MQHPNHLSNKKFKNQSILRLKITRKSGDLWPRPPSSPPSSSSRHCTPQCRPAYAVLHGLSARAFCTSR